MVSSAYSRHEIELRTSREVIGKLNWRGGLYRVVCAAGTAYSRHEVKPRRSVGGREQAWDRGCNQVFVCVCFWLSQDSQLLDVDVTKPLTSEEFQVAIARYPIGQ